MVVIELVRRMAHLGSHVHAAHLLLGVLSGKADVAQFPPADIVAKCMVRLKEQVFYLSHQLNYQEGDHELRTVQYF